MRVAALVPAYGRDYFSRAAVVDSLNRGDDFIGSSPYGIAYGKPINLPQLAAAGIDTVTARYRKQRTVATIVIKEGRAL